jgi:hypothetical protein
MSEQSSAWREPEDRCLRRRPLFGWRCQRRDGHAFKQISARHECHVITEAESLHTDLLFVGL